MPNPNDRPVQERTEGAVLIISLNRPKANAINVATSQALYQSFLRLEQDPALRVGIITGTGRFFSAGWDLNSAVEGEAIDAHHGPGGFAGLTEFFGRTKPIIAAVNGLAMGGGFELALAADLMLASTTAEFALPEARLGMMADSGGVLRLPKRLPRAIANELLLTGRRMGAEEALRWGLLSRVVEPDALLPEALALAASLVDNAPLSIAALLEVTSATETLSLSEGYARMRGGYLPRYQAMLKSQDALEGPIAFAEKRAPRWQGK